MPDLLTAPASAPASAPALRSRLRRLRRGNHPGSLADALTDAYVVGLFLAMYGWATVSNLREFLGSPAVQQTDPGERYWIAVAAVVAGAGLAWQGLRAAGPVLVTPAAQAWVLSSPVDRRSWLRPRFAGLIAGAFTVVGLLGLAAALSGQGHAGWAALAGAACGVLFAALSVIAQGGGGRWARLVGVGLMVAGAVVALVVIGAHFARTPVGRPSVSLMAGVALVALPLAVFATVHADRALGRVDRASLTNGAELAGAAATAAVLLDPSMLTALVESRRWRSVGRVRSRSFALRGRRGRVWVLLQAELRRPLRHPSALLVWAAFILAMYAAAIALPSIEGSLHLILAYLATERLTGGLRAISRSPGLRRALGGNDTLLRLTHIVVPAVGAMVWYASTLPIVRPQPGWIDLLLLSGVVAAVYRAGTRPPMEYGGVVIDSPFGMIPVDLVRQVLRGPDLLATLIVVQLALT